jgi:penicillin amidase
MLKAPKFLFCFITLLLFASVSPLEAQTKAVPLPGISESVKVLRDGRAIPYISAANENDLYFAQGYVTAGDRLWQMDMMRRFARGETAELSGKATLEEDKRWRRLGFAKIAEESYQHLSPELKSALDNYARGVNAYIASLDDNSIPIEFKILQYKPRRWTPADTLIIGKILADALSSTWRQDLLKASLLQTLPKEKLDQLTNGRTEYDVVLYGRDVPERRNATAAASVKVSTIRPETLAAAEREDAAREASLSRLGFFAEELAASNNWVISGKRTADGKPILANDPHLAPTAPGIWYLSHLETPSMRVAGVTFPGVPGIVLGHNEHIAWGATNVGPDVQDLYAETFDAAGRVKTPNGWEAPTIRTETINVRTNLLKPDTQPETLEVTETRNGAVILEEGGKRYSLKWTARDPRNVDFEAFFRLNRAKDWKEFRAALSTYRGATQNFVYADVKGNIGWQVAGGVPIRRTGDGSLPYDGAANEGDWTGFIPLDELPNLYNPPSGLIVTANQRIAGTDYKYPQLIRDFAPPWRARRITDLLNAEPNATMDTVRAAQHDSYNIPLASLAKEIVKANAGTAETLETLKGWDGRMTPDSRAALIANEIRVCMGNRIAAANAPAPAAAIRERILARAVRERSKLWLPAGVADYESLMRSCDAESTATLEKRFGADRSKWTWGAIFASRFPHPLAAAPLIGGQFKTPSVGLEGSGQTPNVGSGVSMRLITSPGNWDATRHVIPLGQSGDVRSSHFKDQFDLWKSGEPAIFPFSRAAVDRAATTRLEFIPAK